MFLDVTPLDFGDTNLTPTPEEAATTLIKNFTRDAKILLASINTEQTSSKERPFTNAEELDKLARMTNNGGTPDIGTK